MLQNILLSTGITLLLIQLTTHGPHRRHTPSVLAAYSLLVALASLILAWRYDLFPALLTLLALWFVLRRQPLLSGIALGFGIAAKLYPIVLLPIFVAYLFVSQQRRASVKMGAACLLTTASTVLPYIHILPDMMYLVHYHQLRGIEIESVPAGLLILASKAHLSHISLAFDFGSYNVGAPSASMILPLLPALFVLAYGIVLWQSIKKFRNEQETHGQITSETLVESIVAALLTCIVCNKVFSGQYIIWLLPFAPLLHVRQFSVIAVVYALTMFLFPFNFGGLMSLQWLPVIVL